MTAQASSPQHLPTSARFERTQAGPKVLWKVAAIGLIVGLAGIAALVVFGGNDRSAESVARVRNDPSVSPSPECAAELKTLQVAVQAWFAQNGGDYPPTEQQLVDEGLLSRTSEDFELDGPTVIATTGGTCG